MKHQRIVITTTCDHCPPDKSADVTGTHVISYGAARYEIDLCDKHKARLDEMITGIVHGARRVKTSRASNAADKKYRDAARAWGKQTAWGNERGYTVATNGILPAKLMADYADYLTALGHENSPPG
jgi:Lsr2